jgi:hypothetical protein
MSKEELSFFIHEQAPIEFLSDFLEIDQEWIEELEDEELFELINKKVNKMSESKTLQMLEEYFR